MKVVQEVRRTRRMVADFVGREMVVRDELEAPGPREGD